MSADDPKIDYEMVGRQLAAGRAKSGPPPRNIWQVQVESFMAVAGQQVRERPHVVADPELVDVAGGLQDWAGICKDNTTSTESLRARLMIEELAETIEAMREGNAVEIADGLVDLIYVVVGTAAHYGIDLAPVFDAVHTANMAKFPEGKPILDSQGKVKKPKNWKPADVEAVLRAQGWNGGE